MRIEWRNRDNEHDILLAVDEESNRVMEAWEADEPLLTDFLNEMASLGNHGRQSVLDDGQRDPQGWGRLVIARLDGGDVLSIDPELYWDRVSYWFRSQGSDPNHWRRRR